MGSYKSNRKPNLVIDGKVIPKPTKATQHIGLIHTQEFVTVGDKTWPILEWLDPFRLMNQTFKHRKVKFIQPKSTAPKL